MDKAVQRFLTVEEQANALVEALRRLYEEANAHQAATQELRRVHEGLVRLIATLQDLVTKNQDALKLFQEIRAQDIVEKLLAIEKDIESSTSSLGELRTVVLQKTEELSQDVAMVEDLLAIRLEEVFSKLQSTVDSCSKGIERVDTRVTRESMKMHETLMRMQNLLLLALGIAFVAAIVGIIGIFR